LGGKGFVALLQCAFLATAGEKESGPVGKGEGLFRKGEPILSSSREETVKGGSVKESVINCSGGEVSSVTFSWGKSTAKWKRGEENGVAGRRKGGFGWWRRGGQRERGREEKGRKRRALRVVKNRPFLAP